MAYKIPLNLTIIQPGQLATEVRGITSPRRLLRRLAQRSLSLSQLLARRVIFTLCSRSTEPFQARLLNPSVSSGGALDGIFDMLFLAVSEGVDFTALDRLGLPVPARQREMHRLSASFSRFLVSSPLAKALGWNSDVDRGQALIKLLVDRCAEFLRQAAEFEREKTQWRRIGDGMQSAALVIAEGAAAMSIMISTDVKLQAGMTVSFYEDPMCSRLLKIIRVQSEKKGEECLDQLQPLEVTNSHCWLKIQHAPPFTCRLRVCALPIHPSLGMGLWCIRYALAHGEEWGADRRALAFQFLDKIFTELDMGKRLPSPLKQRLLSLSLWLLAEGTEAPASEKKNNKLLEARCLKQIKDLKDEFARLYKVESEGDFTLYLQKVLDLIVSSEPLRTQEDRVVQKFEVKAPAELGGAEPEPEPEEEESNDWGCSVCTFLNPMSLNECSMCGSGKPPPQPKKKKAPGGGSSEGSDKMLHDAMVLVNAMRYLSQPGCSAKLEDWPSMERLVEAAWRACMLDHLEDRVVVIENIPIVLSPSALGLDVNKEIPEGKQKEIKDRFDPEESENNIRDSIVAAIADADPGLHLSTKDLLIIEDPSKPKFVPLKPPKDDIPVIDFPFELPQLVRKK
eukprot:719777-Amorphochlora_amoeboformis.AAC.1